MRGVPLAALGALAILLGETADATARSFADNFGKGIGQVFAQSLAGSIARTLPVLAASPGVVYRFDVETGAFVRESSILGQVFLERADALGKGRLDFSLSYQRVKIDSFEGRDLETLRDIDVPIRGGKGRSFVVPLFAVDLDTHEAVTSITYGLTEDLDLNVTVPLIYSEFGLNVVLRGINFVGPPPLETRSTKLGVGDLLLRAKYQLITRDMLHAALGIVLRLPTGNEDNFQGTGAVEVAPMLYLSRDALPVGRYLRLRPYLNAGIDLNGDDVNSSEGRWGIGLDCGTERRFTAAVAVLGRHPFEQIGPPGVFEQPRVGRISSAPLFGLEPGRPDFFDLSVGGRVNLWQNKLIGFVNAIVPLNKDGFRSDIIPLAGIEATF